jgi:ABC-type nickel/cobalt efflux system permease component RcnA
MEGTLVYTSVEGTLGYTYTQTHTHTHAHTHTHTHSHTHTHTHTHTLSLSHTYTHTHKQGFWGWEDGSSVRCGESRDETLRVLAHHCSLQFVICPSTVMRLLYVSVSARASA